MKEIVIEGYVLVWAVGVEHHPYLVVPSDTFVSIESLVDLPFECSNPSKGLISVDELDSRMLRITFHAPGWEWAKGHEGEKKKATVTIKCLSEHEYIEDVKQAVWMDRVILMHQEGQECTRQWKTVSEVWEDVRAMMTGRGFEQGGLSGVASLELIPDGYFAGEAWEERQGDKA